MIRRTSARLAFAAVLALGTVPAVGVVSANADSGHVQQTNGCTHGDSNNPCRQDPSSNGKDCLLHGNWGGTNEDHCDTGVSGGGDY